MKLKFIIDKSYDLELLCQKSQKKDLRVLENLVNEKYRALLSYLKRTLKLYQKSWNEINKEFFEIVEKITGFPWKHKIYFCVLSPFHWGISSWGGNKIIRTWRENPYLMRKITAHELLISHLFTIFERNFRDEKLTNKEKWALAEISTFAICGLEKELLKFWPWISEKEKYSLNHNYPELYNLQKKLKPIYEKKKNFKEFLKRAIKIIKKDKEILLK